MEPKFKVNDVVTIGDNFRDTYRVLYFDTHDEDYCLARTAGGGLTAEVRWVPEDDKLTLVQDVRAVYINFDADGMSSCHYSRSFADDAAFPDRIACVRAECVIGQFDE